MILSASVFFCSAETRVMFSSKIFACVCDCWLSKVFWNSGQNACQFFLVYNVKGAYQNLAIYRCLYHGDSL